METEWREEIRLWFRFEEWEPESAKTAKSRSALLSEYQSADNWYVNEM